MAGHPKPTAEFYDQLATKYSQIERDWSGWLEFNHSVLSQLIGCFCPEARRVLDCAAGVGSQAIALERLGFDVTATDLSRAALSELSSFSSMPTHCLHWLELPEFFGTQTFDVIVCFDNAIGHTKDKQELESSIAAMYGLLSGGPGSSLFVSTRDFDSLGTKRPDGFPTSRHPGDPYYQLWNWTSASTYVATWYINGEEQNSAEMRTISRKELTEIANSLDAELLECPSIYTQPVYRFGGKKNER